MTEPSKQARDLAGFAWQMGVSATISRDGQYRYSLVRDLGGLTSRVAAFVMLNPSTADATQDDPTIRRCKAFAAREGCGVLYVVNLYAYRATKPADLWTVDDPVGPDNDLYLRQAEDADVVIAAWGANARPDRVTSVLSILPEGVQCLGVTKSGAPRHPLYVRGDQPLVPFPPKAEQQTKRGESDE